jgi:hypothetical protein
LPQKCVFDELIPIGADDLIPIRVDELIPMDVSDLFSRPPHGSTICFVVVLVVLFLVVVLLVVGESLIKILLYSPILFYFTMLLQQ